jgi:molecular chaperone GrpE
MKKNNNQVKDNKEDIKVEEQNNAKETKTENTSTEKETIKEKAENVDDIKDPETSNEEHTGSEEKKELSKEEQLKEEVKAHKDKYLRLFAEFENYKRRTSKERLELLKTASQDLMQVMLPVLDDFDRALKEIKKSDDEGLIQGVELISNKLRETLKSKGLEPMQVNAGDTFDADLHEAVTQIPAPDKSMKGKIVDVVEKGYTLGDKIIRFPKVVTGK